MKRGQISNLFRKLKLIYITDWIRFYIKRAENKKKNDAFKKDNPDVKLPPDYLIYESFQIDYQQYFSGSIQDAKGMAAHFGRHIELKDKKILDWGCGPGRIIRQLPAIIGNGCEFYGTDYNKKSIDWCSENLPGIQFNNNSLEADLPYEDNFFDIIYGISIFTHLSENLHYKWYEELYRVLKPNGIMVLTTQGQNFKSKLTNTELQRFNSGELIVRGNVKEGHRTYSAFHPSEFMTQFFNNVEILEHIETLPTSPRWLPQDAWIIKK